MALLVATASMVSTGTIFAQGGAWTTKANLATERFWLASSVVDEKIYAIGGAGGRNLFLIYKEMLHNVTKHAEATKVEIALTRTNGLLQLQVADNGKGFSTEAGGNGNGMKSMQARAGELNGQLEFQSQPKQGTRVTLSVKIP